jgi:hypothetical protein
MGERSKRGVPIAATEGAVPDHGPACAFCGRPGGNRIAYDDAEVRLHRECEDAWIERRMGEEGI